MLDTRIQHPKRQTTVLMGLSILWRELDKQKVHIMSGSERCHKEA